MSKGQLHRYFPKASPAAVATAKTPQGQGPAQRSASFQSTPLANSSGQNRLTSQKRPLNAPNEPASQRKRLEHGGTTQSKAVAGFQAPRARADGDDRSSKIRKLLCDGEGKKEESLRSLWSSLRLLEDGLLKASFCPPKLCVADYHGAWPAHQPTCLQGSPKPIFLAGRSVSQGC